MAAAFSAGLQDQKHHHTQQTSEFMQIPNAPAVHLRSHEHPTRSMHRPFTSPTALSLVPSAYSTDHVLAAVGHRHSLADSVYVWKWKQRHEVQRVTRGLVIGPSIAAKGSLVMVGRQTTMIVSVIDPRLIPWQGGMKARAEAAGVRWHCVPVATANELQGQLDSTIAAINNHLVESFEANMNATRGNGYSKEAFVKHKEAVSSGNDDIIKDLENDWDAVRGQVLIMCDSGNTKSATLCAAYMMAITGCDMHEAAQYVHACRFSSIFEDEYQRVLSNYQDVLKARMDVNQSVTNGAAFVTGKNQGSSGKRRLSMDDEEHEAGRGWSRSWTLFRRGQGLIWVA